MFIELYRNLDMTNADDDLLRQFLQERVTHPFPAITTNMFRIYMCKKNLILKRYKVASKLEVVGEDDTGSIIVHMPLSQMEWKAARDKNDTAGIVSTESLLYEYKYKGPHSKEMTGIVSDTVIECISKVLPSGSHIENIDNDIRINGDKFSGIDQHNLDQEAEGYHETREYAIQTMRYDEGFFEKYLTPLDHKISRGIIGFQNLAPQYSTDQYLQDVIAGVKAKIEKILGEPVPVRFFDSKA